MPRLTQPRQMSGACLGVDPGLNRTGYALIERTARGPALREAGVIRSTPGRSLAQRVCEIGSGLREVLAEHHPALMAVEQVFSFGRNPKTALLLAHARGAILMAAAELEIPVIHYTPTEVKRLLTGSGRASKEQIQHAIRNELGLADVLEPNDVADASAIALCLYHSARRAA
ncbi:MAG: crossover junction endodeoxyribonuclease RuvC [Planctomycetaceae bacterium]